VKYFDGFRLDTENEYLWKQSSRVEITRKAFAVLRHLTDNAGRLVSKDQLMETVWPNSYVLEENLKVRVLELRKALGDDAKSPKFIETCQGRGYRFISTVAEEAPQEIVGEFAATRKPLFGRQGSLDRLFYCFEKARRARRQVVFLSGQAGLGKTALAEEFMVRLAESTVPIAFGQCVESYSEQEPYVSVLEALARLCRGGAGAKRVEILRRYAPTWLLQMPSLVSADEREALRRDIQGATRERMVRELCDALEALSSEKPLLLVLEDLHWSDRPTVGLIAALARRREPAQLMLLGTVRPVELLLSGHPLKRLKQDLLVHRECEEIHLEPLERAAVAEYLEAQFAGTGLADQLADWFQQQTAGNPLFMVTAADYLEQRGLVAGAGELARSNEALERIRQAVPESLNEVLERQIEQLPEDEREVLEAASLSGVEFSAWEPAAALNRESADVERHCDRLAHQRLILRTKGVEELADGSLFTRYEFVHSLYKEVLHRRQSPERRQRLHQRIGERIESLYTGREGEMAVELARHFQSCRDYPRAIRYLKLAARKAASRYSQQEALRLLQSARALTEKLPRGYARTPSSGRLHN
jgi:predicted ATPase/DNA-binding winged helix-turn-helix (wHTH) protein